MKKLSILGILIVAFLTAAPVSLQWSHNNMVLSLDTADARVGRPLTATSVAGVHRRAYRRTYRRAYYYWRRLGELPLAKREPRPSVPAPARQLPARRRAAADDASPRVFQSRRGQHLINIDRLEPALQNRQNYRPAHSRPAAFLCEAKGNC